MFVSARPRLQAPSKTKMALRTAPIARVAAIPPTPGAPKPDPFANPENYQDTLLDKILIKLFTDRMAAKLGVTPTQEGFDGFVEVSKAVMRGRSSTQQRGIIREILFSMLPPGASATFRMLFPPNKFSAEINASITTAFFKFLVGECHVKEVDVQLPDGTVRKQLSGVQIKKCRYLQESGCVGTCLNMCRIPTQDFFTNDFGLPLAMKPNFDDLSCEMIFGQMPTKFEEDAAYTQPCFAKNCTIAPPTNLPCPKVDTERRERKNLTA